MFEEIAGLRRERHRLEASLRRQTGEDLPSGATREELDTLDQQLEQPGPRFFFSGHFFYRRAPELLVTAKSRISQLFTDRVNSNEF
jgi:hypothetical protein